MSLSTNRKMTNDFCRFFPFTLDRTLRDAHYEKGQRDETACEMAYSPRRSFSEFSKSSFLESTKKAVLQRLESSPMKQNEEGNWQVCMQDVRVRVKFIGHEAGILGFSCKP